MIHKSGFEGSSAMPRFRRRWPLLLPLLLVACGGGSTGGLIKRTDPMQTTAAPVADESQGSARSAPGAAPAPSAGTAAPAPRVAPPPPPPLRPARKFASMQQMMEAGNVTGLELVGQIEGVRKLMRDRRSASAVKTLVESPDGRAAAAPAPARRSDGKVDFKAIVQDEMGKEARRQAEAQLDNVVKPYLASIGFGALELHLRSLVDDPRTLSNEVVSLPSPKGMSQAQMQRVVTMAAMVVATRITGKVLQQAKDDFANVEVEYVQLIERREKAAQVLFGLLAPSGNQPRELAGLFSEDDLRYLRSVRAMPVNEFANDLGAQNLALRYLRRADPAAWNEYKSRSDGLMATTRAYIRTVAGVTAFAALTATFGRETVNAMRGNRTDIGSTLPLVVAFGIEALPVLKNSWDVGAAGIVELPMRATRRFRVIEGGKTEDVSGVGDVMAAMQRTKTEDEFRNALFRSGNDGLVYKVYRCDKSEAGRMLDTAVGLPKREDFAKKVMPTDVEKFSFQNAFNAPADNARARELGDELLRLDHRRTTTTPAFGELQLAAAEGVARWNSDQLLRLILANREGTAAHATLQLGDLVVRPVPSMQSVFAYESLVDQCAAQLAPRTANPPPRPTPPATGSRPATPPRPTTR